MSKWICTNCGQEYNRNVCPCDNCKSLRVILKSVYKELKEEDNE